jgi:hypothetical protein
VSKNRLLTHLKNDIYCRIGVSKVHGVIAIKDINPNFHKILQDFLVIKIVKIMIFMHMDQILMLSKIVKIIIYKL